MRIVTDSLLARGLLVLVGLILVLIPFHATLTVWLSSIFGHYTAIRLWKEVLLVFACIITGLLLFRNPTLRKKIWQEPYTRPVIILIGVYVVLHLLMAAVALLREEVTLKAFGYGLISNLRFLAFFAICIVTGSYYSEWIKAHWKQLLLWPAGIVVGFGLLQAFVLPVDFLKHAGYGSETIAPYIAIDQKDEYARVQSTLRGPNPLGAYLVIVVTVLSGLLLATRARSWKLALAITGTLVVLYGTYSRSAWIGLIFSLAVLVWLTVRSTQAKKILAIAAVSMLLVGVCVVFVLRDNDQVQNLLFHTDETSQSATSSNESRAGALIDGTEDIVEQPYGRGPGTAGPASVYNDGNARIPENYFLQIAQEVGVLGVGVFIAICCFVGRALWRVREWGVLPVTLLASLVGITIVNFVSHAWADDTLAYIWWGFTGVVLGATLLTYKKDAKNGKKTV